MEKTPAAASSSRSGGNHHHSNASNSIKSSHLESIVEEAVPASFDGKGKSKKSKKRQSRGPLREEGVLLEHNPAAAASEEKSKKRLK